MTVKPIYACLQCVFVVASSILVNGLASFLFDDGFTIDLCEQVSICFFSRKSSVLFDTKVLQIG